MIMVAVVKEMLLMCSSITEDGTCVPKTITVDDVVRAVLRYYEGGRLSKDKPLGRSRLVNVIKHTQKEKSFNQRTLVKPERGVETAPVQPDSVSREQIRGALQAAIDKKGPPPVPDKIDDNLWGIWPADEKTPLIWENMNKLITKYGFELDIIFNDTRFPPKGKYLEIYAWNATIT